MRLSAFFLITFAIYVSFNGMAEVSPILHISKLILPILILVMLYGTELKVMIGFDFLLFSVAVVRCIPFFDSIINMYVVSLELTGTLTAGLWAYFIVSIFLFRGFNFWLAERIIKKKRLRKRIGLNVSR